MSIEQTTNREKALRMAVDLETCRAKEDAKYDVVATAQGFLDFLEGTNTSGLPTVAGNVDPPPRTPAPKAARAKKPATPAPAVESNVEAPAAAASAPNTSPAPGAAQPAAPTKAAATLDDVRNALVKLQTRKNRDASMTILKKYSPTGTTGGLPQDKYATVISECDSQT